MDRTGKVPGKAASKTETFVFGGVCVEYSDVNESARGGQFSSNCSCIRRHTREEFVSRLDLRVSLNTYYDLPVGPRGIDTCMLVAPGVVKETERIQGITTAEKGLSSEHGGPIKLIK
jgi:hypothetical protein